MTLSHEMMTLSNELMTLSHEMMTLSHEMMTLSHEMMTLSHEMMTFSHEMMTSQLFVHHTRTRRKHCGGKPFLSIIGVQGFDMLQLEKQVRFVVVVFICYISFKLFFFITKKEVLSGYTDFLVFSKQYFKMTSRLL